MSRGDSGSVSSGSTFLQRSQAMEGGWLLVFSPSPLSILFSPSPPSSPLVDKEEGFWRHCENPRVAGFHPSSWWVKHTPPLQREVWSQNRRPGVGWRAYSRSQCRCAHVGNLAMPGESLPLWGSPPRLWPGHHVQLPHRPDWVEGGWSSSWPALLALPGGRWHPPQLSWACSFPQGKAWHDSSQDGTVCLRPQWPPSQAAGQADLCLLWLSVVLYLARTGFAMPSPLPVPPLSL